jgi:outer membrane protein TolC
VAAAQVAELSDRESTLATRQSRLDSDVSLIAALGGGWKSSDLPTPGQVVARRSTPAVAAVR